MPRRPTPAPLSQDERDLLRHFRACTPARRQLLLELSAELCKAAPKSEIHVVTGSATH